MKLELRLLDIGKIQDCNLKESLQGLMGIITVDDE
jgi:hypothetical protein